MYQITRTSYRTAFSASRTIHSTPVAFKTVKEKVVDAADTLSKKMGKGLASAIETGEEVTDKAKETLGSTKEDVKYKAGEASKTAEHKFNEGAAGAREMKRGFEKEGRK